MKITRSVLRRLIKEAISKEEIIGKLDKLSETLEEKKKRKKRKKKKKSKKRNYLYPYVFGYHYDHDAGDYGDIGFDGSGDGGGGE